MTMLKMGHSFTFTDCHHAVLNFLVANSKINFDEVRKVNSYGVTPIDVGTVII